MEKTVKEIADIINKLYFGEQNISEAEENIYNQLNNNFISLCRSLPDIMQNRAMIFLLEYFCIGIGEPADFIYYYYKPLWTIIPRMMESGYCLHNFTEQDYKTALCGEAMSLFLHSLDDHLNDGEIPSSHLQLLLRSQAWVMLNKSIEELGSDSKQIELAEMLINDYYSGICSEKEPGGLDEYCERFRKEMSTMNIFPLLSAKKISSSDEFTSRIKEALEAFGIAWRILDDIQDIEDDIFSSRHTAVYYSLSGQVKEMWGAGETAHGKQDKVKLENIYNEILRHNIIENLAVKIVAEVDKAQDIVKSLGMHGMAEQYKQTCAPVVQWLSERAVKL